MIADSTDLVVPESDTVELTAAQRDWLEANVPAMREAQQRGDRGYWEFALRLAQADANEVYKAWGSLEAFGEELFGLDKPRTYQLKDYGRFALAWHDQSTAVDWCPTERMFRRIKSCIDATNHVSTFARVIEHAQAEGRTVPLTADLEAIVPQARRDDRAARGTRATGGTVRPPSVERLLEGLREAIEDDEDNALANLHHAREVFEAALEAAALHVSRATVESHLPAFTTWADQLEAALADI